MYPQEDSYNDILITVVDEGICNEFSTKGEEGSFLPKDEVESSPTKELSCESQPMITTFSQIEDVPRGHSVSYEVRN